MQLIRLLVFASALAPAVAMAQSGTLRLASDTRTATPARDSAIRQLEDFLAEYPESPLRPNALFQLGELLVRRADDQFAEAQQAATAPGDTVATGSAPFRPNYSAAIARYEELVRRYPDFERIDAAAYTLGTLYSLEQRHAEATRMFQLIAERPDSRFRAEGLFRLGDARFELASAARGAERRALFAQAAQAYEQASAAATEGGDIWFLSMYKLGWSYYNQASQTNQQEYRQAVEVFDRLVAAYDRLTPEQQARLGLRGEAIEYMAIAFTQVGGAQAANQFFEARGGRDYKVLVLRRVAHSLRDQGDFPRAIEAYRLLLAEVPTDTGALNIQREIVDIYQNRMIEPDSAQAARLVLVERFTPGSPWAQANAGRAEELRTAREEALRHAGQFALARAQQSRSRARFTDAATLYQQYLAEFPTSDSAKVVNTYYAEALFGNGEYLRAGGEFARAAYGYGATDSLSLAAGRNAIVAFDSALARAPAERAAQDSLFAAVDRFVEAFPEGDMARVALRQKARRASEAQRWDVLAQTFRTYAQRYPSDPYTPTAQKLIGDALYQQGMYAEAQQQWELAQEVARQAGRRTLADSIATLRTSAAAAFADTLVRRGEYRRAAEEVYVAFADKNPRSDAAPDALRDAIETYMIVLSDTLRGRVDDAQRQQARSRAIELSERLVREYPQYRYRVQYQSLRANLLGDAGRGDEAVAALRELIAQNREFEGRQAAMIRLAVTLDSLGRGREAAEAYANFAQAYPRDSRAADAMFNAGVGYAEAGDSAAAARTFGQFATMFPREPRAGDARQRQVTLLRAAGDTVAADAQLAQLCAARTVDESLRAVCAERNAQRFFRDAVALWPQYDQLELVIPTRAQLTRQGVERASAQKQRLLRQITDAFARVIRTGHPEYLSAATYYVGHAQWEYGRFLENVRLPQELSDEEREQAREGSQEQAEQFYRDARNTWQQLLEKAAQENIENIWISRTRAALQGDIPSPPPVASAAPLRAFSGRAE